MDNFDDKYKKRNPFTVPEGYFEGLTDRITDRLETPENLRKFQKPGLLRVLTPYIGLVAIFLLALFVVQVLFPHIVDNQQMLVREGNEQGMPAAEKEEEYIFDSQFNPTSEEIIEYLASEMDNYELIYAGIYGK